MEISQSSSEDLFNSPQGGMRGRGDWKRSLMCYGLYLADTTPHPSVQVELQVEEPRLNARPKRERAFSARLAKYECETDDEDKGEEENVPVVVRRRRKSTFRRSSTSINPEEPVPSFEMNDNGTIVVINGPADRNQQFKYQPKMARFMEPRPRTPEEQARRDKMNAACRMSRARAKLGATRPYTYRKKVVEDKIISENGPEGLQDKKI